MTAASTINWAVEEEQRGNLCVQKAERSIRGQLGVRFRRGCLIFTLMSWCADLFQKLYKIQIKIVKIYHVSNLLHKLTNILWPPLVMTTRPWSPLGMETRKICKQAPGSGRHLQRRSGPPGCHLQGRPGHVSDSTSWLSA
jgi:hypothetical protein